MPNPFAMTNREPCFLATTAHLETRRVAHPSAAEVTPRSHACASSRVCEEFEDQKLLVGLWVWEIDALGRNHADSIHPMHLPEKGVRVRAPQFGIWEG